MFKNFKFSGFLDNLQLNKIIYSEVLIKKYYKFKLNNISTNNLFLFRLNLNKNNNFIDIYNKKKILFKLNSYNNLLKTKSTNKKKINFFKKKIQNYKSSLYYYKSVKLIKKINSYNKYFNIDNNYVSTEAKNLKLYNSFKTRLKKEKLRFFIKNDKLFYSIKYLKFIINVFKRVKKIVSNRNSDKKGFIYAYIQKFFYEMFKCVFLYKHKYGIKKKMIFDSVGYFLKRLRHKKFYRKKKIPYQSKHYFYHKRMNKMFFLKYCKWFSELLTNILLFSKKQRKKLIFSFSLLYYDFIFSNELNSSINKTDKFFGSMIYSSKFRQLKNDYNYKVRKFKNKLNRNKYFKNLLSIKAINKSNNNNSKFKDNYKKIVYNIFINNNNRNIVTKFKIFSFKRNRFTFKNNRVKFKKNYDFLKYNRLNFLKNAFFFKKKMIYLVQFLNYLHKYINKSNVHQIYVLFKKIKQLYFYNESMFLKNISKHFLENKVLLANNDRKYILSNSFINELLKNKLLLFENKLLVDYQNKINYYISNFSNSVLDIEVDHLSVIDRETTLKHILFIYRNFSLYVRKHLNIEGSNTFDKYYLNIYRNIYFIKKNIISNFYKKSCKIQSSNIGINFNLPNKYLLYSTNKHLSNNQKLNLSNLKNNTFKNTYFLNNKLFRLELSKFELIYKPLHVVSHITTKNYRYHILDSNFKILRSSSLGILGIDRKEMRLKKSKLKIGDIFLRNMKYLFKKNKKKKLFDELHFHLLKYRFPVKYIFKEFKKYIKRKKYKFYKKRKNYYVRRFVRYFLHKYYLKHEFRHRIFSKKIKLYNKKINFNFSN